MTGRVLFVFSPTRDPHDRFFNSYPGSLLYAIAPLVDAMNRSIIDLEYVPMIFHPKIFTEKALESFRDILRKDQPTHLAICSTYDSWHVALLLSREARELIPSIVTIHGGPHLDEVLQPFVLRRMPALDPFASSARDAVDFAISGDGEYALLKLMTDISSASGPESARQRVLEKIDEYRTLPGTGALAFVVGDEKKLVRFRNPIDLSSQPFVQREMLPPQEMYDFDCFKDDSGSRLPSVTMITHRGCKARCTYCSEGIPYQGRSLDHILAEGRVLRDKGVDAIFIDDSTVQDDPRHLEMFAGLQALGFRIGALTRFDLLQDADHVQEMRDSGVCYFYASVEQFDDDLLRGVHKGLTTEEIERGVSNLHEAGISLGIAVLFGLPNETARSVERTLSYVSGLSDLDLIEYVSLSLYSYHPGTPLGSMNSAEVGTFNFNDSPPNVRHPYFGFEEGMWYHPDHVTDDYAAKVLAQAKDGFGIRLVRELGKHRGEIG